MKTMIFGQFFAEVKMSSVQKTVIRKVYKKCSAVIRCELHLKVETPSQFCRMYLAINEHISWYRFCCVGSFQAAKVFAQDSSAINKVYSISMLYNILVYVWVSTTTILHMFTCFCYDFFLNFH